jgi:hypothetical protein
VYSADLDKSLSFVSHFSYRLNDFFLKIRFVQTLDKFDVAILKELQTQARLTNVERGSRIGLSAAPCLK